MAALDQISWVVVGYAVLVALVAAYAAYRWRERPPWLASMAWMLEALLALRAVALEVTEPRPVPGRSRPTTPPTSATSSPRGA